MACKLTLPSLGRTHLSRKPGLEKLQRSGVHLTERLASLGIMGDQLKAPLEQLQHHNTIVLGG